MDFNEKLKNAMLEYLAKHETDEDTEANNLTYEAVRLALEGYREKAEDEYTVSDFRLLENLTFLGGSKDGGARSLYEECKNLVSSSSLPVEYQTNLITLIEDGQREDRPFGFFTNAYFNSECLKKQTDDTASQIIRACLKALELSQIEQPSVEEIEQLLQIPDSVSRIDGFGIGFMSGLFHAVCPAYFPILNQPGQEIYKPLRKEMNLKDVAAKRNYSYNSKQVYNYLKRNYPGVSSMRLLDIAQFVDGNVKRLLVQNKHGYKQVELANAVLKYLNNAADNESEYDDSNNESFTLAHAILNAILDDSDASIDKNAGYGEIKLIQDACTKDLVARQDLYREALKESRLSASKKHELEELLLSGRGTPLGLFSDRVLPHKGFKGISAYDVLDKLISIRFSTNYNDSYAFANDVLALCKNTDDIGITGVSTLLNIVKPELFPALDGKSRTILTALKAVDVFGQDVQGDWSSFEAYIANSKAVTSFLNQRGIVSTRVLYNAQYDTEVSKLLSKDKSAQVEANANVSESVPDHVRRLAEMVQNSSNVIFRGAPGTGKTYLARQIATFIVSENAHADYDRLSDDQKHQIEFVQFHPSYDYSDFVEGLRPTVSDGEVGFELRDGIFKQFVSRARENYEDAENPEQRQENDLIANIIEDFLDQVDDGEITLNMVRKGGELTILDADEERIYAEGNNAQKRISLRIKSLEKLLRHEEEFTSLKEITQFFGRRNRDRKDSYYFPIYRELRKRYNEAAVNLPSAEPVAQKNYVFIIDEINRGEISKILGELFFTIDPGYRGKAGEVSTQYANLHDDPTEKFYIPENVYIIGTMNDIDRSVDTFDFAMRRRFRFLEITAEDSQGMLDGPNGLGEKAEGAKKRMNALNDEIKKAEDLNENYQIGASYFLKLKEHDPEELWTDYLYPLLQDYVRGTCDEERCLETFKQAYNNVNPDQNADNDGFDS